MNKKTYCIFCSNYLPNVGGVERIVYNMAKNLVKEGRNAIVVTSNIFGLPSYEIVEGIKVYRLPCFNVLKGRFPVSKFNKKYRKLRKQLLDEGIDYFVVNNRFYIHSILGASFAKRLNKPCIVVEHGTGHFTVNSKLFDFLGHIYEHLITVFLKKYPVRFFGESLAAAEWLNHFNIKSEGIFYNAVDLEEIEHLSHTPVKSFRKEAKLNENIKVITYAGRLIPEKGILKLITALDILLKQSQPVHLFVAGDGELLEEIKAISHSNITVLGRLDFPNIVALLNETNFFCLPTDFPESFPTSILEAAACKCYCITSTMGSTKELIVDDEHGVILQENTPDNIANTIKYAIETPKHYENVVKNANNMINEQFNWGKVIKTVINTFELDEFA